MMCVDSPAPKTRRRAFSRKHHTPPPYNRVNMVRWKHNPKHVHSVKHTDVKLVAVNETTAAWRDVIEWHRYLASLNACNVA